MPTKHILATFLLAAGALALLPALRQVGQRDIFGRPVEAPAEQALGAGLEGGWQLVQIEDPELAEEGRSFRGFLLVSEGFLAIEVHVWWDTAEGFALEEVSYSGIYEYAYDSANRIVLTCLIGSFLDEDDELDWEDPGVQKTFEPSLTGTFLTLTREDGSRLVFARRRASTQTRRDFFGGERPIEADDERR